MKIMENKFIVGKISLQEAPQSTKIQKLKLSKGDF